MGHENPEPLAAGRARLSPVPSWRASPPSLSTRLGWLGIASAALDLGAVYWKAPVIRPGVTCGDLIDVLTPILLILLYGVVLRELSRAPASRPETPRRSDSRPRLLFTLGGVGLLLGHGIHVAANSIHDAIDRAGVLDPGGLVNWWDEHVSHVTIHGSKALMCVGLTLIESRRASAAPRRGSALFAAGALAYGFITFAEGIEGQTVPLLLPFVLLYLAWSLGRGRPYAPVRLFYTLAAIVSILLFAFWGITHHGFPEFSQVGLIPEPR
jgi:hypothetical protein